jgi:hypothetical protein
MMKSAKWMFGYAAFLMACGLVAYFMAPPDVNATTALIVPSIAAGLMVVFGAMAAAFNRNRTVGMIGIHAGLVLPLVFAAAFAYRAYSTFSSGGDAKRYLAIILTVMAVGSVVAFLAILSARPPKEARGV